MQDKFFYFIKQGRYIISDIECCAESEKTFDIKLFDLANNKDLLGLLNLVYMFGSYGVTYTPFSRALWFCGYLCAFNQSNSEVKNEKAITNPTVRLFIEDGELLNQVKQILTHVKTN